MVAFGYVFLTPEKADVLPILICRDHVCGRMGATCFERKGPTAYSISFLVDWRTHLKDENEPSMKVLQEAMIHSCVEVVVTEMKRQCRMLRISAEHNTNVRITDDISLLNWLLHFAMQFLNKMRTGRRWRKPTVQFGEKFWLHKIREEGINSSVKRMIQGILVGHHDRTRATSHITKSGIVRG